MSHAPDPPAKAEPSYKDRLKDAQIQLTKLQKSVIRNGQKVAVVFEGRDASGKNGVIQRIAEHLSPREVRLVALDRPSDRDVRSWYFQRYVAHLPAAGEIVLFNRSWYNRAGVERVMGFCTEEETEEFLVTAPLFEGLLHHCGVTLLKYYLDISKGEQKSRLSVRRKDPLRHWKVSAVDETAVEHWDDYTAARNAMLNRTHSLTSPWTIVQADDKKAARLAVIHDLLNRLEFKGRRAATADVSVISPFEGLDVLAK
jgi:polyphosphate kinase 2